MKKNNTFAYQKEFDIFRAISVILVILFHLNEWKVTNVEPSLMADFNWNKVDKISDFRYC